MRLSDLPACGPKRLAALIEAGFNGVRDVVYQLPRRYEDRRKITDLSQLPSQNGACQCWVKITKSTIKAGNQRSRLVVEVEDSTGTAELIFFHGVHFWQQRLYVGKSVLVWGIAEHFYTWQFVHPHLDFIEVIEDIPKQIIPVYAQSERFSKLRMEQSWWRKANLYILENWQEGDTFTASLREMWTLPSEKESLSALHFPKSFENLERAKEEIKKRELIPVCIQLEAARQKRIQRGQSLPSAHELWLEFKKHLPFIPTEYQEDVIKKIHLELQKPQQLWGLLQGDVGAGKTLVAFGAALCAFAENKQVALLAPTEILARQHMISITPWCEALGISISLSLGSNSIAERTEVQAMLSQHKAHLAIGTHALLNEELLFSNLALVLIDEQHRFGVEQREALISKGNHPHVLYLSATPIPRTLAQGLMGDMEVFTLLGKLPGRKSIRTSLVPSIKRNNMLQYLFKESQQGRQVFWVVPRIESQLRNLIKDDSQADLVSAIPLRGIDEIEKELKAFNSNWKVASVHGKMKSMAMAGVLSLFQEAKLDVLVATTVVEVGIDIPGAQFLVIENPERFGLAQLHQLRGRVGRRGGEAWCFLAQPEGDLPQESLLRLTKFCQEEDGFKIAEWDLSWRGSGDLIGDLQAGWGTLRFSDFLVDADLIREIRGKLRVYNEKNHL